MIAAQHREITPGIWEFALFDILYPGAETADGNVMFSLAGNSTGVTSDAAPVVDDESEAHVITGEVTTTREGAV